MPSVYIAGPDVFFSNATELAQLAHKECSKRGLTALCPVDNSIEAAADPQSMSRAIFAANIKMIQDSDAVCANIEPFRGPSADAGTVWEIGYAFGLGKPVVGYTTDSRDYKARAGDAGCSTGETDQNGHLIEDFGGIDNLMITHALESVHANLESALDALSSKLK